MTEEAEKKEEKTGAKEKGRPFFATGEIVEDYSLLYRYWRHAGQKAEESVLSEKDFQKLQSLVASGYTRLDQLLAQLREHFRPRIDPQAAAKAAKEHYGTELPTKDAVDRVADQLAGWLIEAASQWGLVRIRHAWRKNTPGEQGEQG